MNKTALRSVLILVGVGMVFASAAWLFRYSKINENDSVVRDARTIVATCRSVTDYSKCYEREIPNLSGPRSVAYIFKVIAQIRVLDPRYQFCHLAAHKVGALRVLDDPEKWIDALHENPHDGLCSNGFIHGVIIGKFRDRVITDEQFRDELPQFERACEPTDSWQPSGLDKAMCYHAIGHLFTFVTNADMHRSLAMCRAVAAGPRDAYLRVCQEGVFMQVYQPVEPDDFELLTHLPYVPTKDTFRKFCADFPKVDEYGACRREAAALLRPYLKRGIGSQLFCDGMPPDQSEACYQSVVTLIGRTNLGKADAIVEGCKNMPASWRSECFGRSALAVIEEMRTDSEPAFAVCMRAEGATRSDCFAFLAERAPYVFSTERERTEFCTAISRYGASCEGPGYTQKQGR
ncbi:hypothetical protein EBR66_06230 [bacterium]|nr:hypothetical protein [bacterium]